MGKRVEKFYLEVIMSHMVKENDLLITKKAENYEMDKVFISTSSFGKLDSTPIEQLKNAGLSLEFNPYGRSLSKEEIVQLALKAKGLIAGTEPLEKQTLMKLCNLKVISRCGVGLDNIDLNTAKRLQIKVFSTPDAPTIAVAELTIGLILALLRKIPLMDREIRNNIWKKRMGNLLLNKQVGIIGFGRIGKKVASLLKAMGASVYFTDPAIREKEVFSFPKVEIKELLKKSDIISLHLSYSKENHKLFGEKEFSLMKQGAFLINCSRGSIVDEEALYDALKNEKLAGVAIDVFEKEPYFGPLKELDNVILTPHIGSYAKEARIQMEKEACLNLLKGLGHT